MNLFKSAVVCVAVVAICGCDQEQPKPLGPTPLKPKPPLRTPESTPVATPVEDMELPESTNSIGMKFKLIPAGTFFMGNGEQKKSSIDKTTMVQRNGPVHQVTITKAFEIGTHEVTQEEFVTVMGDTSRIGLDKIRKEYNPNLPLRDVNWVEAVAYCEKLSSLAAERSAGYFYRLPTEAEWEYACRAGTATKFHFGDDEELLSEYAWFEKNSDKQRHEVGKKKPNAWGLYDMHGNVAEWCRDYYMKYTEEKVVDPFQKSPDFIELRVYRGGSYYKRSDDCSSYMRSSSFPLRRSSFVGFRLVRTKVKSPAEN